MKRLLLFLFAIIVTLTTMAAGHDDDKLIIKFKDGTTTEYNLYGTTNVVSRIQYTASKLGVYLEGLESFGPWDSYDISNIDQVSFSVYEEKSTDVSNITLADASANDAAKQLYSYLKRCYGAKTISSVMADVNWNHTIADQIYTKTGKYPAFNCYDFIHIFVPDNNGWINYSNITPVTEWADAGGLVQLMWHFNVPTSETVTIGKDGSGVTCTSTSTTFHGSNALVDGTWEHTYFYEQMDKVIAVLLKLQDAGVSAVWRPFHEGAGNSCLKSQASWAKGWFWWGYEGADTYKALWKAMFEYFQQKGVHNLIWAWTTQNYNGDSTTYDNDDDWYPGGEYVDIIGRDLYGYTATQNKQEFDEIQSRYPNKMIALAECGKDGSTAFGNISDVWDAGARWSYFMPWYGESLPSDAWWTDAMNCSNVITRDDVDLNTTYVEESAKDAVANMGLGFNLGNTFDAWGSWLSNNLTDISKYETAWGQPIVTKEQITFLKENGFNSVRFPVTWLQHLDSEGNIDEAFMNRVQEVVDYIIDNDMYCILNVHHDTGSGDASTQWIKADITTYTNTCEKYKKIWQQIAERFVNYNQKLVFEGYNEMLDANNSWSGTSTSGYQALNNYAQDFVSTVRSTGGNNATRNLVVNTYAAAHSEAILDALTIPTDDVSGHIAVEVHSYDPWNWISNYGAWNSTCSNELTQMFTLLNSKFVSKGIPCIIGEYGTHGDNSVSVTKSSSSAWIQAAADQAADMVGQAKQYGIATFYWMSIFDGTDRSVPQWSLPTVVDAMVTAYK